MNQEQALEAAMWSVGILQEHLGAKLADFALEAQRAAEQLLQNNSSLFIAGSPGTGKSRFMAAIIREFLLAYTDVRFLLARAFFREIWDVYRDNRPEQDIIRHFSRLRFLALDDLGHEGKVSEAVLGALHEVISYRHGNQLPTAITTNLSLEEIARRYDPSVASRLGSWIPVVMAGDDRRLS